MGGLNMDKFSSYYSVESFMGKLSVVARRAGLKIVYAALLLFYVLQESAVPAKAKGTIIAALGYLVFPADAIPDIIPLAGYSDDFGVLILALAIAAVYINDDVKQKARTKLSEWFGEVDDSELREIDSQTS
jgi:uncharacterized membrane protein YkvA (DUF1232 family)